MYLDEATFRQDATICRTWARVGQQPEIFTHGKRSPSYVFGAIAVSTLRFLYRFAESCNARVYLKFLEYIVSKFYPNKIFLIVDNARYHKEEQVNYWYQDNHKYIECWFLPPYSPEFNAMESIWRYIRRYGTHNRFFETKEHLKTALKNIFRKIQYHPNLIKNYIWSYV